MISSFFSLSELRDDPGAVADLEDSYDRIRERAGGNSPGPDRAFLGHQHETAQARTADVGEILQIQDHEMVAFADRRPELPPEIKSIGAIDTPLDPAGQISPYPLGTNLLESKVLTIPKSHKLERLGQF